MKVAGETTRGGIRPAVRREQRIKPNPPRTQRRPVREQQVKAGSPGRRVGRNPSPGVPRRVGPALTPGKRVPSLTSDRGPAPKRILAGPKRAAPISNPLALRSIADAASRLAPVVPLPPAYRVALTGMSMLFGNAVRSQLGRKRKGVYGGTKAPRSYIDHSL